MIGELTKRETARSSGFKTRTALCQNCARSLTTLKVELLL
jgi:hypothetical protein